jgi:hypothetical protein
MTDTNFLLIGFGVTIFVLLANFMFFFGIPLIVWQLQKPKKTVT